MGSVRLLTNSAGRVTYAASYDPYGKLLEANGAGTSNLGFTGEYTDASGLLYLRARYANLSTGTFLSRDPVLGVAAGQSVRWNTYLYAGGNPVNYTDPSGEFFMPFVLGAGIGAVSDIIMQLIQNGGRWECIDWKHVLLSAGIGGLSGIIGAGMGGLGFLSRLFAEGMADFGLSSLMDYALTGDANLLGNLLGGFGGFAAGELLSEGVGRLFKSPISQGAMDRIGKKLRGAGDNVGRVFRNTDAPSPRVADDIVDNVGKRVGKADRLPYITSKPSPNMVAQELDLSCGPACALQVLKDNGVIRDNNGNVITEKMLRTKTKYDPQLGGTLLENIAKTLNRLHPGAKWRSGGMSPEAIPALNSTGHSWIAGVKETTGGGHAVIVDKIEDNIVHLRDPHQSESSKYGRSGIEGTMKLEDFLNIWKETDYDTLFREK